MPEESDNWVSGDDIPWADPAIRKDYEAALGRFILVHNECDILITRLIERCLNRLGNPPALQKIKNGEFAKRVENLLMFQSLPIELELSKLAVTRLLEINRDRNVVAHGHFDQNPFDGDYVLIRNSKRYVDYSTERLDQLVAELDGINRQLSVLVDFYDPPVVDEHEIELALLGKDPWAEFDDDNTK